MNYFINQSNVSQYGVWWIRTPGANHQQAAIVDGHGYVFGDSYYSGLSVANEVVVVRPVMHISLSALDKLEFAGTVSSDGEEIEPTQTPVVTPTAETSITPTVTPNPTAKVTKYPQKETIASALPDKITNNTLAKSTVKMGKIFNDKGINYKITKLTGKKGKLTLISIKNKKTKKITIPKEVKKYGYKFTITQIGKNVFTRCKKLKRLTIKSRTITKIGKNKFPKKCKIVVPQAMKKKYTRLLKKK